MKLVLKLVLKLLGGLSACWMWNSNLGFVLVKKGVAGEIWLWSHLLWKLPNRVRLAKLWVQNSWQRCFLLAMHYTSFKAHSYVLLSCSQTFLKNPWSGKWHSKPGWMTSFKGPLKTLLHVTNRKTRSQKLFFKCFFSPLHYQELPFLGYLPSLVQESLG